MKLKLMNTKITALGLALLMINAEPVLAATIALNGGTGTSCSYTAYSADSSGNLQVTCDNATLPAGTPVCTLTASPSTISSGGSSQLTANCSGSPTSYTWTGSGTDNFTSSTSSGPVSPTSTATYTVTGSNIAGTGNTASVGVTVSTSTSSTTPSTVSADCTVVDVTWKAGYIYNVTPWQNLASGKAIAFRMTVDAGKSISQAGTGYAEVPEILSVSTTACDFSSALSKKYCMAGGNNDPVMYNGPGSPGAYCNTPAGSVIYYNVKHANGVDGNPTCPAGKTCRFSFYW